MTDCPTASSLHLPLKEDHPASADFSSPTAFFRSMFSATPNTTSSATSPFSLEPRFCDFSGSPGRGVFSATGTPAYADSTNPFFSEFEAGIHRQARAAGSRPVAAVNASASMTPASAQNFGVALAEDISGWDATVRKQAFKRLSLGSSVASSAPSTAASEAGEDAHDFEWARLSAFPDRLNNATSQKDGSVSNNTSGVDHPIEHGLSEAFSQQHLAGPCSFQDHYQPISGGLNEDMSKPSASLAPTHFNLEEFISPEGDDQLASLQTQQQTLSRAPTGWSGDGLVSHFSSAMIPTFALEQQQAQNPNFQHNLYQNQHSQRRNLSESTASTLFSGHSDASSSPMTPSSSTSSGAFEDAASSHHSSPFLTATKNAALGESGRSMSFNGQGFSSHDVAGNNSDVSHQQISGLEAQISAAHPQLARVVAVKPETPVRSYSTSNIHDSLSCNPAYITPGSLAMSAQSSASGLDSPFSAASASPMYGQALFTNGSRHEFPESPTSSVLSSPLNWSATLVGDDAYGEETYRASSFSQGTPVTSLSSSLPHARQALYRSQSSAGVHLGVPATSGSHGHTGGAGQPMRQVRSSLAAASVQACPYGMTPSTSYQGHHRSPVGVASQHPLLSSTGHPLLDLQNPYSGVITKRSRGRRVPSTPEEMTNVGKSGKVYTCKVPGCGKLFKRSEHLKRHIRSIHTDEKPFLCQICHKRFSRHDNLNQHMRVHGPAAAGSVSDSNSPNVGESGDEDAPSPSTSSSSHHPQPNGGFMETNGGTITNRRRTPAHAL